MKNDDHRVTKDSIRKIIKPRNRYSRKGDNGIVLIIGGSRIYHGAPLLSSIAAFRSGVDLVYTAIPKVNLVSSRMISPDLIFLPLPDDKLTLGSCKKLFNLLPKKIDSTGLGMGLGIAKPQSLTFLIKELVDRGSRITLDASALIPEILTAIVNTNSVITPHPGEFKRLFGELPGQETTEKIKMVLKKAKEYGINIVLKGHVNIISDGSQVVIIERTTPSMTVGGTGDILSGLISGFQTKYEPFESCVLGLYFNGRAALKTYENFGLHMLASDILTELPKVMKEFDQITDGENR